MTLQNALREHSSYITISEKKKKFKFTFNSVRPEAEVSRRYIHKTFTILAQL